MLWGREIEKHVKLKLLNQKIFFKELNARLTLIIYDVSSNSGTQYRFHARCQDKCDVKKNIRHHDNTYNNQHMKDN